MFLVPLTFFHCFLVSKNRTTYENFKFSQQAHPFDLGSVWRNWWSVCFATTPPPAVNFRAPASTLANFVWWNPGDPWEQKGQVLEADSEDEEEELGGDGAGGGPSEGPHGAAQGGDIEEGGGGDGASTASGAIKRFFRKSRAGTPGQSRPGTPGPGQSLSDASAPMGGEHVGVELVRTAPRQRVRC